MVAFVNGVNLENWVVSENTLRIQDLLRNFCDALENLGKSNITKETREFITNYIDENDEFFGSGDGGQSAESWAFVLYDELESNLNSIAVDNDLFFGALENDGSCFGFWKYEEY